MPDRAWCTEQVVAERPMGRAAHVSTLNGMSQHEIAEGSEDGSDTSSEAVKSRRSSQPGTAVTWLLNILTVVLLMAMGLILVTASVFTSPANFEQNNLEMINDAGIMRVLIGMLALFALPWYRKAPAVVMLIGLAPALVAGTDPFVVAVGLTVWIVHCTRRWHWYVALAGVLVIVANMVIHLVRITGWEDADYRRTAYTAVVLVTILCLVLVLSIGLWTRQKRTTQAAQADALTAQANTEELSDELVRQREREELAREVHDTLASRLSVLSLQTGSLENAAQRAKNGDDADLDEALRTTRNYADMALCDLRALVSSLREGPHSGEQVPHSAPGGIEDVQDVIDDAGQSGLDVRPYILLENYESAPDAVRRAVLRVTQEALTNALRHGSDTVVELKIQGAPGQGIYLEFLNHREAGGEHFTGGTGTGLVGLRERVELLGGVVSAQSSETDFRLIVRLPWGALAAEH